MLRQYLTVIAIVFAVVFPLVYIFGDTDDSAERPELNIQTPEDTTGIGPVAGTLTASIRPERLSLEAPMVAPQLESHFGNAPEWVRAYAQALMEGKDAPDILDITQVDKTFPGDIVTLDNPSSLLRTAYAFDRMDVVIAFLEQGMNPNTDDHMVLWKSLEQWTPATHDLHTKALSLYIEKGGDVNIAHDEGFSAIELAATVSGDVVVLLIENGASPWVHPDGYGAGLMERLSLHTQVPFVLDMLEIIARADLEPADTRALENTIGNLVDTYDALVEQGAMIGVNNGEATGEINAEIKKIATIVMKLAEMENTPWGYIPQEFVDMKNAELLPL